MRSDDWPPRVNALADAVKALREAAFDTTVDYRTGGLDPCNELRDMTREHVEAEQARARELFALADRVELDLHDAVHAHLRAREQPDRTAPHGFPLPQHVEGDLTPGTRGCVKCGAHLTDETAWAVDCPGKAAD